MADQDQYVRGYRYIQPSPQTHYDRTNSHYRDSNTMQAPLQHHRTYNHPHANPYFTTNHDAQLSRAHASAPSIQLHIGSQGHASILADTDAATYMTSNPSYMPSPTGQGGRQFFQPSTYAPSHSQYDATAQHAGAVPSSMSFMQGHIVQSYSTLDASGAMPAAQHGAPQTAMAQTAQPTASFRIRSLAGANQVLDPTQNQERVTISVANDDYAFVRSSLLQKAEELFDAIKHNFAPPPADWPDAKQAHYIGRAQSHLESIRKKLLKPDAELKVQALCVKHIEAIVKMHEVGVLKVDYLAAKKAGKLDEDLTCSQRIRRLIQNVKDNKAMAKDAFEGNKIEELARGPDSCMKHKLENAHGNWKRKEAKAGGEDQKTANDDAVNAEEDAEDVENEEAGIEEAFGPQSRKRKSDDVDSAPAANQPKPKKANASKKFGGRREGGETKIPAPQVPGSSNEVHGAAAGTSYGQHRNIHGQIMEMHSGVDANSAGEGYSAFNGPTGFVYGGSLPSFGIAQSEVQTPAIDPRLQDGSFGAAGRGYGMHAQGGSGGVMGLQYGPQGANGLVSSHVNSPYEPVSGSFDPDNVASEFDDLLDYRQCSGTTL